MNDCSGYISSGLGADGITPLRRGFFWSRGIEMEPVKQRIEMIDRRDDETCSVEISAARSRLRHDEVFLAVNVPIQGIMRLCYKQISITNGVSSSMWELYSDNMGFGFRVYPR